MIFTALLMVGLTLYGVPLARAVDGRLRGAGLAGAAFLLGAGAAGLHLFVLSVLRVPWSRTSVLLAMAPLFLYGVRRQRLRFPIAPEYKSGGAASALQDLGTVTFVVAYAIFALWAPPFEWDFYGIWGLKAKWFFETRGMDWATVPQIGKADYPVLMPLLFDFVATMTKTWNDVTFGWIYVGLCAAMLAVIRGMFADEVKYPALATLVIAFPVLNLWIGLAEAGVMAFGCAGLLFIRRGSITMGAILLGLAAWCKNEGLALIVVSAIALFLATRKLRDVLKLWPSLALIAPWMITRAVLGLRTDFTEGSVLTRVFERLGNPAEVIDAFVKAPPDQPWFWIIAVVAVLVFIRDAARRERFLLVAVALQLGLFFAQALATTWDFASHVSLTLNRLPHQMAPAMGFLAVSLLVAQRDRGIDGRSAAGGDRGGDE